MEGVVAGRVSGAREGEEAVEAMTSERHSRGPASWGVRGTVCVRCAGGKGSVTLTGHDDDARGRGEGARRGVDGRFEALEQ